MGTITNVIEVAARCYMGMETKKLFKQFLSNGMNRENFIKHIALGAFAVVGGGALARICLSGIILSETSQLGGYGGSAYGGAKPGGKQPARRVV